MTEEAEQASAQVSTAEVPVSRTLDEIIKEAKRIEEDTLFSSKGHFAAAEFWSNFHLWVGLPAAVLSAIAAASALSDKAIIAGVIAIVVAGLTSVATFMNPSERNSAHFAAGNSFDALMNQSRIFWTIDCWQEKSVEILTATVKGLSDQKIKLNQSSPQVPGFAYRRAKKGIEAGEGQHQVDKVQQ